MPLNSTARDEKLEAIIENEREWRRHIYTELKDVKDKQSDLVQTVTTLKVKFGLIGGFFGTIGGLVGSVILKKLSL